MVEKIPTDEKGKGMRGLATLALEPFYKCPDCRSGIVDGKCGCKQREWVEFSDFPEMA